MAPTSRGMAATTLVLGILGIVAVLIFVVSDTGAWPLYGAIVLGVAAIVFGAIALKLGQSKGFAITGMIFGAVSALVSFAIIIFALLFIGALVIGAR